MATEEPSKPPGPDGLPIVGNAHRYVFDPLDFRTEMASEYGGISHTTVGPKDLYLVTDPEHVEEVLVANEEKFIKPQFWRRRLDEVFGYGLLLTEGDFWGAERELQNPAFTPEKAQSYARQMIDATDEIANSWDDGEVYSARRQMNRLALRNLFSTLFSTDVRGREWRVIDAVDALNAKYKPTNFSWMLPSWFPSPANRKYVWGLETLNGVIDELITRREARSEWPDDLLTTLIEAKKDPDHQMDREILEDEIRAIALGGSGPVGLSLTTVFHQLSQNPAAREKLFVEVDEVLDGDTPEPADVFDLEYTEYVVKEAIRLYPAIFNSAREAVVDFELGEYTIPAGSLVNCTQWAIHRNERYFPNPEAFDPDRWANGYEEEIPNTAYIPFGAGPRTCLGKHFALVELQLVVATLAKRFRMDLVDDAPLDVDISSVMKVSSPVEMRFHRR